MSDGFDKLKEIGAQKIHEKTHITREHVQAILHHSFEGMNKIQFLGFVSILERDYDVKLGDLKIRGLDYFLNITPEVPPNSSVFVETKKKLNSAPYIVAVMLVLVVGAFFILNKTFSTDTAEKSQEIDDDAIEHIKNNFLDESKAIVEINSSNIEINSSIIEEKAVIEQDEPASPEIVNSFKIMPNKQLWMGYTDLKENKSYQKLFLEEFSLDPTKDWLLNLGHGNVNFEIDGKIVEYNSVKNLKFLYKDNNLTEINYEKFNLIQKDHKW